MTDGAMPKKYDVEFKARAARLVRDDLDDRVAAFATMRAHTWVVCRGSLGRQAEQVAEDLAYLVAHVAACADGVLSGSPAGARWVAASRTWTTIT